MFLYSKSRISKAVLWLLTGTPEQKRRVRLELARISASMFGDYYLGDDYKLWREDKVFLGKCNDLAPAYPYSQERKFTLREFVRFVRNVPGSMAECGCYQGASAWFMANELPDVRLLLFDSFSGLSEPGNRDFPVSREHFQWQPGDLSATEVEVRKTLRRFQKVSLYKGWIPDRFDEVRDEHFRIVHIDVDLYQPTLDCMKFFYPRISLGGIIVLDDYGQSSCMGAHEAIDEYMDGKPEYVIHLPTSQGVIVKG